MSKRNLERFLERRKIPHARALATMLLQRAESTSRWFWMKSDSLSFKDELFTVSAVVTALENAKLITRKGREGADRWKVFPTDTLVGYLSLAKQTKANTQDIVEVKERLELMEKVVSKLIEQTDPPVTPQKIEAHLKLVQSLDG